MIRTTDDAIVSEVRTQSLPESLFAPHNVENLKLAILAAAQVPRFTLTLDAINDSLAEFQSLPHRLEVISTRDGRIWVDDSLSTTPESVVAAIESFVGRELVVIVGGMDRGIDYSLLSSALFARLPAVHVICLPDNGLDIVAAYHKANPNLVLSAHQIREAVELARQISGAGAVIVMSPGAPSQNVYRDFEDKSSDFQRAVATMAVGGQNWSIG